MNKIMNNYKRIVIVIFLLLTVISISQCTRIDTKASDEYKSYIQPESLPPIDFTWEIGLDCRTVVFTSSIDKSSNYSWDFTSDGIIDAWGKTATNTYPQSDVYNVTHCAMILGSSECVSKYIGIAPPKADFEWNAVNLSVTFYDKSSDCDGEITFWGWDFTDDGRFDDFGETAIYEFSLPGTYNVALVVEDDDGFIDLIRKNVTVMQPIADLECTGFLHWSNVTPNSILSTTISIKNIGDPGSKLDWVIQSKPDWGTWSCSPSSGTDLTPEQGSIIVGVTVTAPDEKNTQFTGEIKFINTNDPNDYEIIQISLTTPKFKPYFIFLEERYPLLFNFLSNFH